MSTDTEVKPLTLERYQGHEVANGGDKDVTHVVDQRESAGQDVATAYIEGTELVALCGHRWVPTKDPQKLPLCRACVDVLTKGVR